MTDSSLAAAASLSRSSLLLLGLGLAVLGVVAYVVQISLQRLMIPWYMPILGLLGVVLVALSLSEKRTVWRVSRSWRSCFSRARVRIPVRGAAAAVLGANRGGTAFPSI